MVLKRNVRGGIPSPYPRTLFHGLRCAQLISSLTVGAVMMYFMYYLRVEKIKIPWTFILLLAVSLLTMLVLTTTIVLYNFTYLSPRFNLGLNGVCGLLWGLGMGLLSWSISISNVLGKACNKSSWDGQEYATTVCRGYKALWCMTLIALISTLTALFLDIKTQSRTNKRGVYYRPKDDKEAAKMKSTALEMPGLKAIGKGMGQGYKAPVGEGVGEWTDEHEQDIGYHNRYGSEEVDVHDHLAGTGYNGKPTAFRD